MLGLLLLLRVPRYMLTPRAFCEFPATPPKMLCEVVDTMLGNLCVILTRRDYRGLAVLGVAVGFINSLVGGLLASTMYYAEDWTEMDGAEVQRQNALSVAVGSVGAVSEEWCVERKVESWRIESCSTVASGS